MHDIAYSASCKTIPCNKCKIFRKKKVQKEGDLSVSNICKNTRSTFYPEMSWISSRLPWKKPKNVVRVLRLAGNIAARQGNSARALNLRKIEKFIDRAFDDKKVKPKAVCLEINSPGGSAVQSNLIYNRIRSLSKEKNVPVLSFTEDYAVSGGYWLAVAGDEIYVDPNSILGSIGVLMYTFGMVEAIKKLGIERRVILAGENKLKNDPFAPEKPEDIARMKLILSDVHNNFTELVKQRRPKIDPKHRTVFTGEIFCGAEAVQLGLADGIVTDMKEVVKQKYGKDVVIERCDAPTDFFQKFMEQRMQASPLVDFEELLDAVEVRMK